jgi:hypothetical protein
MNRYTIEIIFENEKHCLQCPLREYMDDSCKLQAEKSDTYDSWEEQMMNCPLIREKEIDEIIQDVFTS